MNDKLTIVVFPDYMASGLWDGSGTSISHEDDVYLKLSKETKQELEIMEIAYSQERTYFGEKEIYNYDIWSYKIALLIKKDLPEYRVGFFNDGLLRSDLAIIKKKSYL